MAINQDDFTKPRNKWPSGSTISERLAFYSKPLENGCIEWGGTFTGNGRPTIKIGTTTISAYRAAWIEKHGPIPEGKIVRHVVCANKRCINVDHLALGTHFDNAQDRARDGNTAKGTIHYKSILTEEQVKDIILWHESHRAAARRYGVGMSTIVNIRRGITWKHLPRPVRS